VLALISTGPRHAVASRRHLALAGRWVWHWKHWIDRRFMEKFRPPAGMNAPVPVAQVQSDGPDLDTDMRCGGCGSKIGADILTRALARVALNLPDSVDTGPGDDAAVVATKGDRQVLTLDGFSDMVDDPWLFGQIAASHALNDVFAMGAKPDNALAWVTVPLAADALMEEDLYQVLAGANSMLEDAGAALAGGHSSEGLQMTAGFAVTGVPVADDLWRKGGADIGDRLILTKPIGTGVLLAGHMRGQCQARWFSTCTASMRQSNAIAVTVLRKLKVSACTDITGFGLAGHALEMARASAQRVELWPEEVPILDGAAALAESGTWSSLQTANETVLASIDAGSHSTRDVRVRLLCDPQTSGGLLVAVPAARESRALEALSRAGYAARVVGRTLPADDIEPGLCLAEALAG
jgi:selenide,water dikinase